MSAGEMFSGWPLAHGAGRIVVTMQDKAKPQPAVPNDDSEQPTERIETADRTKMVTVRISRTMRNVLLGLALVFAVVLLSMLTTIVLSSVKPDLLPQGPRGVQGVAGPQGARGPRGHHGKQGKQGSQGFQGARGTACSNDLTVPLPYC